MNCAAPPWPRAWLSATFQARDDYTAADNRTPLSVCGYCQRHPCVCNSTAGRPHPDYHGTTGLMTDVWCYKPPGHG